MSTTLLADRLGYRLPFDDNHVLFDPKKRHDFLFLGDPKAVVHADVDDVAIHSGPIGLPWFETKLAAAECHRSQHTMFRRNNQEKELRDFVRRSESYRHWPAPRAS